VAALEAQVASLRDALAGEMNKTTMNNAPVTVAASAPAVGGGNASSGDGPAWIAFTVDGYAAQKAHGMGSGNPVSADQQVLQGSAGNFPYDRRVLRKGIFCIQVSVAIWARAIKLKGFSHWSKCAKLQGYTVAMGTLRSLQDDNKYCREQLSMAHGTYSQITGRSKSGAVNTLEKFFKRTSHGAMARCLTNFRRSWHEVAAFAKVGGEQRMSAMVTMGSVLSSWKGRNARGRKHLAGFTRLLMFTALPDMVAIVTTFAKWRITAVEGKARKASEDSLSAVESAARARTQDLGTSLERMVRQASGVERITAMLRVSDTQKASSMFGSWRVFTTEARQERSGLEGASVQRKANHIQRQSAAKWVGNIMQQALMGQQKKFFYEWKQVKQDRQVNSFGKGVEKVKIVLLSWQGFGKLEFFSRWRERTRVSRACQQVAAVRRVADVLHHNKMTRTMGAVASWRQRMTVAQARRARDDDVGKVAWRYQKFGHQLVGALACSAFHDKVKVLRLCPAMTRWKERSFFHVVPPHRYSYQSFGRQMVAAQQVANILDRSRILGLIWALSTWNEVVFVKNSGSGLNLKHVMSPSTYIARNAAAQSGNNGSIANGIGVPFSPPESSDNWSPDQYRLFGNQGSNIP